MKTFYANLTSDVRIDDPELGQEVLIRARVVTLEEETIDVTRLGHEPEVIAGLHRAKLVPLSVSFTGRSSDEA